MSLSSTIIAIETSCDETSVAVVQKKDQTITVLAEKVSSQIDIHKVTGGVVPEVAAREHAVVIQPMVKQVLEEGRIDLQDISAIAVTVGPGLMPALSVGVTTAQTLAYAMNVPIVPVHHLEGHIYAALLSEVEKNKEVINIPNTKWPVIALIVSGGHTMLIRMKSNLHYEVLGSTRDDAAGEAFDKTARLLGLEYPGGPAISRVAQKGDANAFDFTRPMLQSGDLDFSFSGLKTEVFYAVRDLKEKPLSDQLVSDLAASFQKAVADTLITKTGQAIDEIDPGTLLLSGGVAANDMLRNDFRELAAKNMLPVSVSSKKLCGDNATMIGFVGVLAFEAGRLKKWSDIDAQARINLEQYSVDQPDS
jgi:N6-L-threonylcarbamoyladenine synthase